MHCVKKWQLVKKTNTTKQVITRIPQSRTCRELLLENGTLKSPLFMRSSDPKNNLYFPKYMWRFKKGNSTILSPQKFQNPLL